MLVKTSEGMSIVNSPSQGFASFGLMCKRRIILTWIFLRDLATMPLDGNRRCTFPNLDRLQYLSSNISAALWSSLKKLFTRRIPSPLETLFKRSDFARSRAGWSDSENFTLAAILNFFGAIELSRRHLGLYPSASTSLWCNIEGVVWPRRDFFSFSEYTYVTDWITHQITNWFSFDHLN